MMATGEAVQNGIGEEDGRREGLRGNTAGVLEAAGREDKRRKREEMTSEAGLAGGPSVMADGG